MNRRHQTVRDTELVVEDFGDRSQAVRRAGCVRYELRTLNVFVEVYTAYEHRGIILGGSGHYYVFGTCFDVSLGFLFCKEETRRFNYVLSTNFVPFQVSRIAFSRYADVLAVYNQFALFYVCLDRAGECTVHRVILKHVSQVINRAKVVDSYNLDVAAILGGAENETANTTETVNTYFDHNVIN